MFKRELSMKGSCTSLWFENLLLFRSGLKGDCPSLSLHHNFIDECVFCVRVVVVVHMCVRIMLGEGTVE